MPPEGAKHHSTATHPGDLVRLDYDLWAESAGRMELVDTTHQEVAQEAKVAETTGHVWGPRPHLIGGDYFPTGVENALVGLGVGEEVEKEFTPADAFGERDPKLIELFSMHQVSRLPEMRREDAHLDVGTVLTIEGRRGRVVSLTQARVRVDFNPSYAGRKVRGKFKVVQQITEPADQVRAIVELQYGRSTEFQVDLKDRVVTLQLPERSKFDINWLAAKPRVIDRIRSQVHPASIRVVEEYVTPVTEKPPEKPTEKSAEKTGEAAAPPPAAAPEAAAPPAEKPHEPRRPRAAAKPDAVAAPPTEKA
jgi:FKBP-type peptidyl-prolyl cis-trans isomerase 2